MRCNIFIALLLYPFCLFSQPAISLDKPVTNPCATELYTQMPAFFRNASCLFLFTDKSIYTPNEMVWFSAFDFNNKNRDTAYHPFFVMLADRYLKRPVWSGRFVQRDRFVAGSFALPGNIADGNYELIAYSDGYLQGQASPIFYKSLSIRSMRDPVYNIIAFDNFPRVKGDSIFIKYLASSPKPGFVMGAKVVYRVYVDSSQVMGDSTQVGQTGEIFIRKHFEEIWRGRSIDMVLNISKDGLSETKVFPVLDHSDEAKYMPSVRMRQEPETNRLSINFTHITPLLQYRMVLFDSDILYTSSFRLRSSSGRLTLPNDSFPAGYLHVALLDSLGKKVAEDAMVMHNSPPVLWIQLDSVQYSPRSVVTLKLTCRDVEGRPIRARLALSCVLDKRVRDTMVDVGKYYYYDDKFGDTQNMPPYDDTFKVRVRYFRKVPREKVPVLLLGGRHVGQETTNERGELNLTPAMMLADACKKLVVSVAGNDPRGYTLDVREPDSEVNKILATRYFPSQTGTSMVGDADMIGVEERDGRQHTLQAVVVKANLVDRYAGPTTVDPEDPCGEKVWICACFHWKCNGCRPLSKPIKGQIYYDRDKHRMFLYDGCGEKETSPYIKTMQGLEFADDFVSVDYRKSMDADLGTTLYWSPYVAFDSHGAATISFYTNDLKGRFRVSIQGYTEAGPLQESRQFMVR